MARWRIFLIMAFVVVSLGGILAASTGSSTAFACENNSYAKDANGHCVKIQGSTNHIRETCNKPTFFGLEPWYEYLTVKPVQDQNGENTYCEVQSFTPLGKNSSVLLIALAIVDDLLRIAGIIAVVFIIVGGFKFITSQGSPDGTTQGRTTIINALIGLVIALVAISLVSFIGHKFGA